MALHGAAGVNYYLAPAASEYNADKGGRPLADYVRPAAEATYYLVYDLPQDATGLQFAFARDRNLIVNLGNAAP